MACKLEIDNCTPEEWSHLAENFYDNNVYQTRAYQQVRAEREGQVLKSIIVKENDQAVLMFHMRIQKVPLTGLKIGYVQSGPLMLRKDGGLNKLPEALCMICDLCYEKKFINVMWLNPHIYDDESGKQISDVLAKCGINKVSHIQPYHTIRISLKEAQEEIGARLNRDFRRKLRKAEQRNIEIKEGTGNDIFAILMDLYAQSKMRKGFKGIDAEIFAKAQEMLSPQEKAKVTVAFINGQPVTAHLITYFGKVAVPIISANNQIGLEQGSSYIVWWRSILEAKSRGMEYYDLGGIDKSLNPQGYQFKNQFGGEEIFHIGAFEVCKNSFIKLLWHIAEILYKKVK